jgi:hypothetical protein
MDVRIVNVLALAALSSSAILAQDIAGTWQGKLPDGANDRGIVYKINTQERRRPDRYLLPRSRALRSCDSLQIVHCGADGGIKRCN